MSVSVTPSTILLLDDDPIIAMDAAMEIEDHGHKCHIAYDLASAFDLLNEVNPDAALLDFDLGGHTSLPIAVELHEQGLPFAFVTGREVGELSSKLGTTPQVFTKPVNYADVARHLLMAA
ncbi:hypothetical protein [Oricola sp.]|uniref:hypothetical protein n=1 Tax=Oricola sp. TaxID=1979950 RepID=UPI0025CC4941|nr:hypothetical protein [Oricola sp.]